MDLIRREKKKYAVVKRDRLSIKEKLIRLKEMLKEGETTQFETLLDANETGIIDKVITFISLLELARLKKLQIFQNDDKGSIYIEVKESLESFDPESANGFDPEGETPAPKAEAVLTVPADAQATVAPVQKGSFMDSMNNDINYNDSSKSSKDRKWETVLRIFHFTCRH